MPSATITKMKVENFETWKSNYDRGEAMRRSFGVRKVTILRDASEPNLLIVVTRFDSVADAKKMLGSDEFKQAAAKSGSPPLEVFFTEVADDKDY